MVYLPMQKLNILRNLKSFLKKLFTQIYPLKDSATPLQGDCMLHIKVKL
jgi:hypothetical protein